MGIYSHVGNHVACFGCPFVTFYWSPITLVLQPICCKQRAQFKTYAVLQASLMLKSYHCII